MHCFVEILNGQYAFELLVTRNSQNKKWTDIF